MNRSLPTSDSSALVTQTPHLPLTISTSKPRKDGPTNKTLICSHCGDSGHSKARCYEIIGYPEWWDLPNALVVILHPRLFEQQLTVTLFIPPRLMLCMKVSWMIQRATIVMKT
ncbi:hypothetical protein QN277_023208 [Acacia crassicarpa]|uniref:CCHC-type domain-containing protein n=1 Tax=Acacia crassicarpa TaxID=499986 RepID=A0AAE1MLR2_9FABA|nr:hypothetical protein QN277_023208 [Acacia crassicarpa]